MRYCLSKRLSDAVTILSSLLFTPIKIFVTIIIWRFAATCLRTYMVAEVINQDEENKKAKRNSYKRCRRVTFIFKFFLALIATSIFVIGHYQLVCRYIRLFTMYGSNSKLSLFRRGLHSNIATKPKLSFPKEYYVTGILKLPYGNIEEPFEAWYSGIHKRSRIDYYGGMDKTYQREEIGDHGFAAKVVPEYSEEKQETFLGCLHRIGTKRLPIKAQNVVPSPLLFKFKGNCIFNKTTPCWKWGHKFTILTKANSYTLYTTRTLPTIPLRYEMMGYDTLLASYYDKYILDYLSFSRLTYDLNIFEIPAELDCFDLGNSNDELSVSSFNPMFEFISHQNDGHIEDAINNLTSFKRNMKILKEELFSDQMDDDSEVGRHLAKNHFELIMETIFREFKNKFEKDYKDEIEHVKRKDIFRHNMRFINTRNRQNISYTLKMNHFGDITDKEMAHYKGLLNDSTKDNKAKPFVAPMLHSASSLIPISLDWRDYGAVASVRSQGICGSCYAYAVTGAMEGAYYLKTGDLIDLSEQQIIDCSWGFGNKGCKGGYPHRAMQWIIKHGGLATQKSYGKYLAQEGYCHFENITTGASLGSYRSISSGNITQLKMALALYGPVTILINTRPKSFKFYNNGIYHDKDCDHRLDHAALLVGYGEDNGNEYWLIKNSWSTSWGDDGYIKISMNRNTCGVTENAVFVIIRDE